MARSRGPVTANGKRVAAANTAFAVGAVTPEGQARSAQKPSANALLADTLVFPGESEERFCDLLAVLEQELQPEPGIETDQVRLIGVRLWSAGKPQYLNRAPRNTV